MSEWLGLRDRRVAVAGACGTIGSALVVAFLDDTTGAALFLASDDAHHITRSYMIADGGYSMLGA